MILKSNKFQNLKVCVIGYGSIGIRHSSNLKKLGVELFVYRSSEKKNKCPNFDDSLNFIYSKENFLKYKFDAIVICNPTHLHFDFIKYAVERNINFFVEKPISHSSKELNNILKKVEDNNLVTCVGYMMRYDPCIKKIKEYVSKSILGKALKAKFEWFTYLPNWHPWENYIESYASRKEMGGGVVLTCSHEIDTARYIFGELNKISSNVIFESNLNTEVDDAALISLSNKKIDSLDISLDWTKKNQSRYIDVQFEEGHLKWDFFDSKLMLISDNSSKLLCQSPNINDLYINNMSDFLSCCVEGRTTNSDIFNGYNTLRMCEQILEK